MIRNDYELAIIRAKEILRIAKKYGLEKYVDKAFNEITNNQKEEKQNVSSSTNRLH